MDIVPLAFLGASIVRAFIAARFAAMVSGVCVRRCLVSDRRRDSAALGGPVKALAASSTNPFTMMIPRATRIRDHHPVMKPRADWPEGI